MDLEPKLKLALDESRLLILGAQVLFGFQFQAVFQDAFKNVSASGKAAQCAGLVLMLFAIVLLIAPSTQHQIVYAGESRRGALEAATRLCSASLFPLTLGLGASMYVVFGYVFSPTAGVIAGSFFTLATLLALYGLGLVLRIGRKAESPAMTTQSPTSLQTKIEQLLTEARVIIPGGQALLGFQFVATLTGTFGALPFPVKLIHALGLCAVAIAVVLLMTPAALHRIAYGGEDDKSFFRIGSALVVAATFPLALGISCDVFVVFYVVSRSDYLAMVAAAAAFGVLLGFWIAYPLWRRSENRRTVPLES
jgi:hypothetical protein